MLDLRESHRHQGRATGQSLIRMSDVVVVYYQDKPPRGFWRLVESLN